MVNTNTAELEAMVTLVDDTNDFVRSEVAKAFIQRGEFLKRELDQLSPPFSVTRLQQVYRLVKGEFKESLAENPFSDFVPGTVVHHQKYGYRGVVVDLDFYCMADDHWYKNNRTSPDRHQSWYHILVDGSDSTTYAAESNLVKDGESREITHPYLSYFFSGYQKGVYERNGVPWPPQ